MIPSSSLLALRFTVLLVLLVPAAARTQSPEIRVAAASDKKTIELSQWLTATLTIEGPAPLRVELPKQLLVPEVRARLEDPAFRPGSPSLRSTGIASDGSRRFGWTLTISASRWRWCSHPCG